MITAGTIFGLFMGQASQAESQYECTRVLTNKAPGGTQYTILGYKDGRSTTLQQGHAPSMERAHQITKDYLSAHHLDTPECVLLPDGKMVPLPKPEEKEKETPSPFLER